MLSILFVFKAFPAVLSVFTVAALHFAWRRHVLNLLLEGF